MTGAIPNEPRFVTMERKLAENRERLERNRMKDCTCVGFCKGPNGLGPDWRCVMDVKAKDEKAYPGAFQNQQGMTLRQYYFAQVAPAWVLAMAMRFHHEGYDDESAMMEAVRKAYQTANEMVAIQETK